MAEREKEVIITDGGGGGGSGVLIAVVLLLVVLGALFFAYQSGMFSGGETTDIKADVKIDTPTN